MFLQQLTPEWRAWLVDNVARGCSAESLQDLLVKGGYAVALSAAAVAEARESHLSRELLRGQALPAGQTLQRPAIDVQSANQLQCSDGQQVRIAAVLDHPQLVLFEDMLSDEECAQLIALADQRMSRSTVVDEQLGESRPHEARTSAGGWFQRGEFALLARIEARLSELLHWPVDHGEGLQVLRYGVGGEYRAHFDYFNPALPGSQRHLQAGGQRVGTCILYLDEVAAGGGTRFPTLGFEVRPKRGAALYFASVDAAGQEDPATLHAGVPVIAGVKYIATKWLRQRAYQ